MRRNAAKVIAYVMTNIVGQEKVTIMSIEKKVETDHEI